MSTTDVLGVPKMAENSAGNIAAQTAADLVREALLRGQVADRNLTAPPGSPAEGVIYIPAATATGAWAGQEGKVAIKDQSVSGGWRFLTPWAGLRIWIVDEAVAARWTGSRWAMCPQTPTRELTATATATLEDCFLLCRMAGGAFTVTLPPSVNGKTFVFRNISASEITLTIDGDGTEKIDGATTKAVTQGNALRIVGDGSNWFSW